MNYSGVSTSLLLIATGAVLALAVHVRTTTIDINAIGGILMVVGIIGLIFSLIPFEGFGFYRSRGHYHSVDDVDVIEPVERVERVERVHRY